MNGKESKVLTAGRGIVKTLMSLTAPTAICQTFYEEFVNHSWQNRREKWEEEFSERIRDLENDIDIEKIKSIPNFASILASAQQGAMTDIEEDKVGLYANFVINLIKKEDPDNTKTHIFLNILSKYSLAHIESLRYFNDPKKYWHYVKKYNIHAAMYYQMGKKEYFDSATHSYQRNEVEHLVIKDLLSDYFITVPQINFMTLMVSSRIQEPITTSVAGEFLNFIAENE